ncbi:ATP-binding protein [Pontibacillus salicampi]|uniref:histidine kinase n=1 Tax=Pontibacillus salicampi TaxID=1449801 RepID=A0ABV6LR21_9BACI
MGAVIESYSPILIIIAILLTLMTTYTALDLFTLLRNAKKGSRFLFLGGISSMGIGIWVMNFLTMLAMDTYSLIGNQIPFTILSMILSISFSGMALYVLANKVIPFQKLLLASLFLTLAVFSAHVTGMYTLTIHIQYHWLVLIPSLLLIYGSFLFSLWVMFSYRNTIHVSNIWLKPLSSIIITAAIVEGYFLLTKASLSLPEEVAAPTSGESQEAFVLYLVLFITILITAGILWSSTLVNNRLTTSDTYLSDIEFALDASSIIAITNQRGIITYVNDKFLEISKFQEDELIGQDHRILNSGYHPKEYFKDLWRTIGTGNVWRGEIRNRAKDGTYYWVDTTIVPFLNEKGKPYQYLAIRNDITERKKTEEVLHRQDKLAAVGQLAAGVAHEIRNPLTSMRGYAEFLQLDEVDHERREYLDIIVDEIERVNTIVEDFMMLAKPKEVELSHENIVPILRNVLSLLSYTARKYKVNLHLEAEVEEVQLLCDADRLKQVFINLVKNGIEATPRGGDVTVELHVDNQDIIIRVKDTGKGISSEEIKKLGEPFYTTKQSGNGLGLMTSFKIIESHHGSVRVESEKEIGTSFIITLPSSVTEKITAH